MSLSWQTSTTSLLQVGFSVGDIATLAGAGRAIVTWMTTKSKDAALLEFLDVDSDTLIERTGLVDVTELKNRWGKDLKLFLDGKCRNVKVKASTTTELSKFSWTLTLISAALHASLEPGEFQELLTQFTLDLFDDHPSQEYLRHELEAHIGGWTSFATVHRILDSARHEWQQLARNGVHPLGCIPRNDKDEILRFLKWLTKDKLSKRFTTSSSDIFSLALVLQRIGIVDLRTHKEDSLSEPAFDDKHLIVILTVKATESSSSRASGARKGMPIPVSRPEDVMHFWPYERFIHSNPFQDLFIKGKRQAKPVKFRFEGQAENSWADDPESSRDFVYEVDDRAATDFQLTGMLGKVANQFFLYVTDDMRQTLIDIARDTEWRPADDDINAVMKAICDNRKFHGMFQAYLLGYWYEALSTLVDQSRMESTEAFGSWGWWDQDPLDLISKMINTAHREGDLTMSGGVRLWRHDVLRTAAYLLAGAPTELIRRVDSRTTGIVAKLCILSASMLGMSTSKDQAGKLYLLDIDGSCIPNRQGIVIPGRTPTSSTRPVDNTMIKTLDTEISLQGCPEDFTAHIEPDWSNDRQTSLICYRSKGRVVQRLSPVDCDIEIVNWETALETTPSPQPTGSHVIDIDEPEPPKAYLVPIARFFGAEVATHNDGASQAGVPLLLPTQNLPRARTCLLAMYATALARNGMSPRTPYQPPPALKHAFVLYDEQARPIAFA
ncbi:hypothetical protein CC86DRAFT_112481 [Ophiobolus disseminans]|uniref:Uncharacterized protein n=1 Tax=Ophiobolus disseminans TaxID=1469910 RepID=A0A6A6ZKV2_9PLEO|nr:hypothetical protein CC86DRAFT_112481 [Ophiobolus disseminans]